VALINRRSDEEKAARAAQKEADREAKAREMLRRSFYASPAGQARIAFEGGAKVFQYESDVKSMTAVVRPIGLGSSAMGKETLISRFGRGPVDTLNAVCDEGWELVNGSFVFVETGQKSRDKALGSGQQVAVSGTVVGYYLFKRNEANKSNAGDAWDVTDEEAMIALAEELD
jgi:hypothetical protein